MTVLDTRLLHSLHPVGIVIEILILRERWIVVELDDVCRSVALLGIEIGFFQQHRIVVAIKHFNSRGLMSQVHSIAIGDSCLPSASTLRFNLDNAVSSLRTPSSRSRSILEDVYFLYIIGINA